MPRAQKPRPTLATSDIRQPAATNRLLDRLKGVVRSRTGWTARCPAHDDNRNSLSIHHRNGRWLLYCHAGCGWAAIIDAIGVRAAELFDDERGQGE
jgi:putative DNA primase/helicase